MSDLDILNSLNDRDITVFLYHRCLNCTVAEIARIRNLTTGQVSYSLEKIKIADSKLESIAAIRMLFCNPEK